MYRLHIANRNYSSWSLRPWVLLRALGIDFEEQLLPFHDTAAWQRFRALSPAGKVPALEDGAVLVWDSLAIAEYLAEHHPGVWPQDPVARAWARSAAAEMHSGFGELRNRCSMNCGVRIDLGGVAPGLQRDLDRLSGLWSDGLARFGGPFLAGAAFTAADAFYAPVAFRLQGYGLSLADPAADAYWRRLLELEPMRDWYAQALAEDFRDAAHEADLAGSGELLQDLRTPERSGA